MSKYLIMKRTWGENYVPLCLTDAPEKYGYNYEIWESDEEGNLKKIKGADTPREKGFALYYWDEEDTSCDTPPVILEKYPNKKAEDFSRKIIEEIAQRAGFTEKDTDEIYEKIQNEGEYGEAINDKWWVVFGEYRDDDFDCDF